MSSFRRRARKVEGAENPFWITYSDLLSSLVMVFLVLLLAFQALATLQNEKLKDQLRKEGIDRRKLEKLYDDLKKKKAEAERYRAMVRALGIERDAELFQRLVDELKGLAERVEGLTLNETSGEVRIDEAVLFDEGRWELKPRGKAYLRRVIPLWGEVVTRDEYRRIIQRVIFEGHADATGPPARRENYRYNLNLTLRRAHAVADYVLDGDWPLSQRAALRELVSASGRSNTECIQWLKRAHPDWGWVRIRRERTPAFRRVSLRLTFRNPLLQWHTRARDLELLEGEAEEKP